jgi:hypothetical protein
MAPPPPWGSECPKNSRSRWTRFRGQDQCHQELAGRPGRDGGQVAEHHAPVPAALDDTEQEARVARQTVELGDQQRRALGAAGGECRGELRPVGSLAALDFLEHGGDRAASGGDVARHRLALRFEAQAGASLPFGAEFPCRLRPCDRVGPGTALARRP